jgi:hypothetical protein
MLGDGGRIEFRNMRIRNVRPSRACAAVRVLLMTPWLVCAGLCGAPAPAPTPADARAGRAVLSPPLVAAACFMHHDHALRPATAEHCIGWSVAWLRGCTSCVVRFYGRTVYRRCYMYAVCCTGARGMLHRRRAAFPQRTIV